MMITGSCSVFAVGHTVLSVNGLVADGRLLKSEGGVRDILDVINDSENYPIAIKFGRAKLSSNEKIMLAGMFHSLVYDGVLLFVALAGICQCLIAVMLSTI